MAIGTNVEQFNGKPVIELEKAMERALLGDVAVRLRCEYDGSETFEQMFNTLMTHSDVGFLDSLIIGMWGEAWDSSSAPVVKLLTDNKDKLPNLAKLFIGDITAEECEISWIIQSNMSSIWDAFPNLERFTVRGGNELALGKINHKSLTHLTVETGGLPASVAHEAMQANAPIKHFELWLGDENYGASTSVSDFKPLLDGDLFPELETLGLKNCEYADDLAEVLATSAILGRIKKLDISMGTLTNRGARALIEGGQLAGIDLDISHHYVTETIENELKKTAKSLVADDRQEPDEWDGEDHYYIAVSE